MVENILRIEDLKGYYRGSFGVVHAVDGVTFTVKKGDIVAIAGESGCGKSTLAELITGTLMPLLHHEEGQVYVNEIPVYVPKIEEKGKLDKALYRKKLKERRVKELEKKKQLRKEILCKIIGYVPQASQNSLNPVKKIKRIINDVMRQRIGFLPRRSKTRESNVVVDTEVPKNGFGRSREEVFEKVITHFEKLGLDASVLNKYSHELSGGMKQRTVVGISTLWNPSLLIVDEPTSALDVSTQKLLLDTFLDLKKMGVVDTIVFISHDLPTLAQICTKCFIMYAGKIVEIGDMDDIIHDPMHPYSKGLMHSIASFNPDGSAETRLEGIPGRPPNLSSPPIGCRFYPRCSKRMDKCSEKYPPYFYPRGGKKENPVACWLYE
ncbi:MAG: ABC transporter ATP-binding protein [Candidatus Lokiarchaeota archaeon]|nr:ABC transporter ATP-binding protein [Candidatus Lokiarchaeota archaeon]